jgi:hypothetical protein
VLHFFLISLENFRVETYRHVWYIICLILFILVMIIQDLSGICTENISSQQAIRELRILSYFVLFLAYYLYFWLYSSDEFFCSAIRKAGKLSTSIIIQCTYDF